MYKLDRTLSLIGSTLLLSVTALIFLSVILRYLFNAPIPDTNDLSRLGLGIALMSGIALGSHSGQQITMDTLWVAANDRWKRKIDIFAVSVTAIAIVFVTWTMIEQVEIVRQSREQTFDFRLPLWIFYGLTSLAAVCASLMAIARLLRLFPRTH